MLPARLTLSLALALTLLLTVSAPLRGGMAPLDTIQEGSAVAVVIPRLGVLSNKLASLNDALKLNSPQLADALTAIKGELGVQQGLHDDGAVLLVVTDVKAAMASPGAEPPMVMILPVNDYAAFLNNFESVDTQTPGVTQVTLPTGVPGFAKSIDGFAVLGPNEEQVAAYRPGMKGAALMEKAGPAAMRTLADSDAYVYVDVETVGPLLVPQVDAMMAMMQQQMAAAAGAQPGMAEQLQSTQAIMALYATVAKRTLEDTRVAMLGIDLKPEGVGVSTLAQFKADSYLAKVFHGRDTRGVSGTLARLPVKPFLFASSADLRGIDIQTLWKDTTGQLPKEMGWMGAILQASAPAIQNTRAFAQVWYSPDPAAVMTGGLFSMVNLYEGDDANAGASLRTTFMKAIEATNGIKVPMPNPQGQMVDGMTFISSYQPDTLQMQGVSVDLYQVTYQFAPDLMAQMGPAFMVLGGQGQKGYVAAKGPYLIATTSTDTALLKDAIAALDNPAGLGMDERMVSLRRGALGGNPAGEGYVDIGQVATLINGVMGVMGQPPMLTVPAGLPPLATSTQVSEGAVVIRGFAPMATIQFIGEIATSVQAMTSGAQGGGPGGGGGGGGAGGGQFQGPPSPYAPR